MEIYILKNIYGNITDVLNSNNSVEKNLKYNLFFS